MNNTTDGNIYSTQMIKPMALPKSHTDERILAAIDYIQKKSLQASVYRDDCRERIYVTQSFLQAVQKRNGAVDAFL